MSELLNNKQTMEKSIMKNALAFILGMVLFIGSAGAVEFSYRIIEQLDSDGEVIHEHAAQGGGWSDIYDAMEDGTYDGPWQEREHVVIDTSTFTTFEEYQTVLDEEFDTKADLKGARIHDRSHIHRTIIPFQEILNEILERGIATADDIFYYQVSGIAASVAATSWRSIDHSAHIMPDAYQILNQVNPENVDIDLTKELDWGEYAIAAAVSSRYDDTNTSFNLIWDMLENTPSDDLDGWRNYRRAQFYYLPLGNEQQAYDIYVNLAEEGLYLVHLLRDVTVGHYLDENPVSLTEELLWNIVYPTDTEFLQGENIDRLIMAWDNIKWYEYTTEEVIDICNKYLMTLPVNDETSPFLSAIRDKRQAVQ